MPSSRILRCRRAAATTSLLLLLIGIVSCGTPPRPPETEIPGYLHLQEAVGNYDFSPLRGRRIVVDPGHGGHFRGAVGLNGLTEAEVNLGVALYLRGLLEWAGATVHLTRTADYDFLSAADSTLAHDLAARVALADSLQPDVFLSIHHNSNASLDRDLNETQTYYPVGSDGASLDLARAIHKHLVRNLEIEPAKLMAGNFHVLRNATVPAVLGEPAMLSNPVMENRLTLARSHELEASAYFLGLLEYFAGGTPCWTCDYGDTITVDINASRALHWHFEPGGPDAPLLDPTTVRLQVDGEARSWSLAPDGRGVTWHLAASDLDRDHRIELSARNLRGHSTPVWRSWLPAQQRGGKFRAELWRPAVATEEGANPNLLTWRHTGQALADFLQPRLVFAGAEHELVLPVFPDRRGWLLLPDSALPGRRSGSSSGSTSSGAETLPAALHWRDSDGTPHEQPLTVLQLQTPPSYRWRRLELAPGFAPGTVVPGERWQPRRQPHPAPPPPPARTHFLDTTAPVVLAPQAGVLWLEAPGAFPIVAGADVEPAEAAGLVWRPLLPDMLGKVIIIDPTGGGSDTDGTGPLGTRGADLNLDIARRTADLLRGAGATVVLTREDETWWPPEQKVLRANRCRADLFLTIGRSAAPDIRYAAAHHHGSRNGQAWARYFATACRPLLAAGESTQITASYAYLLRHTACPALQVGLELPRDVDSEARLNTPAHQQAEARALVLGIAGVLCGPQVMDRALDPAQLIAAAGPRMLAAERIEWARLDGNLFWLPPRWSKPPTGSQTGASAVSLAQRWRPGPGLPSLADVHTLEVHAGSAWQLWQVRLDADAAPAMDLLLENR